MPGAQIELQRLKPAISENTQKRFAVLLIVSGLAVSACGEGHRDDREVAALVDDIAGRALEEGKIQGLVVAVARDGSMIFERGYGFAHADSRLAMTDRTVIDYFSIGKHMTAAVLLRLAERDELDLDSPAKLYLPEADFEGADVTVRQLLSHTSGLWEAEENENELPPGFSQPPPEGAVLEWANRGERLAGPGETWMYSNGGYLFAGEIAERLTGETLENLFAEELAGPLGLERFGACADFIVEIAAGYTYEGNDVHPIADVDPGWWGGSGNVCGTAGDLMRWWLALQSGLVLEADSFQQMFSPIALRRGNAESVFGYGLGIRIGEFRGHSKIGHTGSGSGGTAILADYPEVGVSILAIVNTAGHDVADAADIEAEIAAKLLGVDLSFPAITPIPEFLLAAAPGLYRSPYGEFCVSAQGKELWRSRGNADAQRMHHTGDGHFAAATGDYGVSVEYFLGAESGKAQWFAYDYNGFPQDLAIRVGDECG